MDEDTRNLLQHIYESLDRKYESLDLKFEMLDRKIGDVAAEVKGVHSRLDEVEERIAGLSSSMLNYAKRVEALRSEFAAARERHRAPQAAA